MSFEPIGPRVVVRLDEAVTKTASGIYLAPSSQERPQQGTVLSTGQGEYQNGVLIPMSVKTGDVVVFAKGAGAEVAVGNEKLFIVLERDIIGIQR